MNKQEQKRLENNISRTMTFAYKVIAGKPVCSLCNIKARDEIDKKMIKQFGRCYECSKVENELTK